MTDRYELHKRNKHNGQYDFTKLTAEYPPLKKYVFVNEYGTQTIDFFNPKGVKALNKALLISYYNIKYWDIPKDYLCPSIPGRANYIHYIADLINPLEEAVSRRCLDIGTGANCIYPIIGCAEYGWTFVGTDINPAAISNAHKIITCNPSLAHKIELRLQSDSMNIFEGVIAQDDYFDATICNPPFHSSAQEAQEGTLRKMSNLKGKRVTKAELNFGGNNYELCCEGGEIRFLLTMIAQSVKFQKNCGWFTAMVSKEKSLRTLYTALKKAGAAEYKTIEMYQGTKISRILAWRF